MAFGKLEDLEIFRQSEAIADRLHTLVQIWPPFDKKTTGSQIVRAADSIGANIAESFSRFHYGDKLNFLYYARGSAYEVKFWIRRAEKRGLLPDETIQGAQQKVDELIAKLNAFIRDTRNRRNNVQSDGSTLAETTVEYLTDPDNAGFDGLQADPQTSKVHSGMSVVVDFSAPQPQFWGRLSTRFPPKLGGRGAENWFITDIPNEPHPINKSTDQQT